MSISEIETFSSKTKLPLLVQKIGRVGRFVCSKPALILAILAVLLALLTVGFLFMGLGTRPDLILPPRVFQVLAMLLIAVCVGYSTVVFQTLVNARILSPGVLGFESVYMFIQTSIVFFLASGDYFISSEPNFILSIVLMVWFSLLVFFPLLIKDSKGIYVLLLVGMIISTLFASLTTVMQMVIDPAEFDFVQTRMFASFSSPNTSLIIISAIVAAIAIIAMPRFRRLDVLSLGRDNAISLGLNYKAMTVRILIIVSLLVSVSVALVGPIMFLGLLAANVSYQIIRSHRHKFMIPASILVAAVALMGGQFLMERIINSHINIAIIINFIGGIYFIVLLIRQKK